MIINKLMNFRANAKCYGKDFSKGNPKVVAIELTNVCPMNCVMCPSKGMTREKGFMDFILFKKIVDQAFHETDHINLELFGDSLMHPEIEKFLNYLKQQGIKSQLSTNAIMLTKEKIKQIKNLDYLIISLDAQDEDTYKKIRNGAGTYEEACENIDNLLKEKERPYVVVRMIKNPLLNWKKFQARWKNADKVAIKEPHTFGLSQSKWNYDGMCFKMWEGLHILWDGTVVCCCYDYDKETAIGDANKQTLSEIWNCAAMIKARRLGFPKCKRCTERLRKYGMIHQAAVLLYWENIGLIKKLSRKNEGKNYTKADENIIRIKKY